MGKRMSDLKKELLQDEEFRSEYVRLEDEFVMPRRSTVRWRSGWRSGETGGREA